MSFFIPPPFPFVEAWPLVFERRGDGQWLTPDTHIAYAPDDAAENIPSAATVPEPAQHNWNQPAYPSPPLASSYPSSQHQDATTADNGDDDDEYEYGYVMTDEWRDRLLERWEQRHASRADESEAAVDARQAQPQRRPSGRRKGKQRPSRPPRGATEQKMTTLANSRAAHLQQEMEAAKARELAQRWRRQRDGHGGGQQAVSTEVRHLEAAMNLRFDELCDAHQPVVWPHAAAH